MIYTYPSLPRLVRSLALGGVILVGRGLEIHLTYMKKMPSKQTKQGKITTIKQCGCSSNFRLKTKYL